MFIKLLAVFLFVQPIFADEVVVVGDSLTCGPFGIEMVHNLSAKGHVVTLYCSEFTQPKHWLNGQKPAGSRGCKTMTARENASVNCVPQKREQATVGKSCSSPSPRLESLLANHPGAKVIVAIGTNSAGGPADRTYSQLAQLVLSGGHACYWVTPPHFRPDQQSLAVFPKPGAIRTLERNLNQFTDQLEQKVSMSGHGCQMIDSRDATMTGSPGNDTLDGLHRPNCAGKAWADAIFPQVEKSIASGGVLRTD